MTRVSLSTANRGEITGHVAHEVLLIKIAFPSGTLFITTHDTPVSWNSQTWTSGFIGDASGSQGLAENASGTSTQSTITLSGLDPDLVSAAVDDDCHWKVLKVWTAYLDEDAALVDDPIPTQSRLIGAPTLSVGKNSGTIAITLDSILAALKVKAQVLGSDADQQKRFAGDELFHVTAANLQQQMMLAGKQGGFGGGRSGQNPGNLGPPVTTGNPTIVIPPAPPAPPLPPIVGPITGQF